MNTEILGILLMFTLTLLISVPLGKYMAKVYGGERTLLDTVCNPVEKILFKLGGIDPTKEQTWKQQMAALLTINLIWFLLAMFILTNQSWLPLNPDKNPNQSAHLAFNTSISFLVNCNLQHYSGETGVSYLSQLFLMFLQFVTAATGMAAAVAVFYALRKGTHTTLGNFYNFFLKSITRILLPISIVIAVVLLLNHTPMTFHGKSTMISLQGDTTTVSTGPVAAFVPIKHLGTNGGGFFGANSSHPLENVNSITNMTEMIAQMIIPFAMVFALGFFLKRKKTAWIIWAVMTIGFLLLVIPNILVEMHGNPKIAAMGVNNALGNMEGKEVRIGSAASAYWSVGTTVISTGSVNSMHDSYMPLSGMNMLLAMMINCFYGGAGVGILNYFVFVILAVFISGLMVGRTPEFMGKKIEAREMKIAMIVALLHPLLILAGTALASFLYVRHPAAYTHWLNTPGYHGFSEMLYEYTSSAANNGSGFEGLGYGAGSSQGDNTLWWNVSTGIVLILARFLPIIGPVAIAGSLAAKKYIPESAGTLKTDTPTFGFMVFAVIAIVAALAFFPALTLGPIAEYFSGR
ncbi:MAG: potassium-transporting ATPase subunit KdpA [Chitinophagaceae bacterium]|jgi:K+-transporting ATPase ATPase A chain|nr:potassium-transporting ATPase subunit KdpA [Chitinophagaceae bacterium]